MNTVFLVDDDESYRELVLLTLEEHCEIPRTAGFHSGEALVAHLRDGGATPDLVILDLHLGGTPGLEVLRSLRCRGHKFPVAMLTGAGDPVERQACLAAGATAVLVKPVAYKDLIAQLKKLVAQAADASAQP